MRKKSQADFIKMGESAIRHNKRVAELVAAAESAADWLCDAAPGTDQKERGDRLRKAAQAMKEPLCK